MWTDKDACNVKDKSSKAWHGAFLCKALSSTPYNLSSTTPLLRLYSSSDSSLLIFSMQSHLLAKRPKKNQ